MSQPASEPVEVRPESLQQRSFRKLVRYGSITLLLTFATHALLTAVMVYVVDRKVQALRSAGEPILPQDLPVYSIPADQNAVTDVNNALGAMTDTNTLFDVFQQCDDMDGQVLPMTPRERTAVAALAAKQAPALAEIRRTQGRAAIDWGVRLSSPVMFQLSPGLRPNMWLGTTAQAAAYDAHVRGDDAAAVGYLGDLHRLSVIHDYHPALAGHAVALGMGSQAAYAAWEIAPRLRIGSGPGRVDPAAVLELIAMYLDDTAARGGLAAGLRSERILVYDMLTLASQGQFDFGQPGGVVTPGRLALLGYVTKPAILFDTLGTLDHYTALVQLAAERDWQSAASRIPVFLPDAHQRGARLHTVSSTLVRSVDKIVEHTYRVIGERRLAAVALAIQLYRYDNDGQFPPTLEALVPGYLPSVPIDALDGNLVRYRPPPMVPVVYGVGDDFTDDGGTEQTSSDANNGGRHIGKGFDRVIHLTSARALPSMPAAALPTALDSTAR